MPTTNAPALPGRLAPWPSGLRTYNRPMGLNAEAVQREVAAALREDVGGGDVNAALVAPGVRAAARVVTRDDGVFCGQPWATAACEQVDAGIVLHWRVADGDPVAAGDLLLELEGPAQGLLTVERTAINFMQLLSGTATQARRFVDAVANTGAVVLDTRKTVPGLRAAQKYAVRTGGARNHRMGLFDAYLLKENHLALAGGIKAAVQAARRRHPGKPVQVEVERNDQLIEAIAAGADRVLLDNYGIADLKEAVAIAAGAVLLEASGGITLGNVAAVAATGVDFVSVGEITKNVAPLDISMRMVRLPEATEPTAPLRAQA